MLINRFYQLLVSFVLILSSLFMVSPALAQTSSATLSLTPASGSFNLGCSFTVNVMLNTGGVESGGTDAVLIFDPTRFKVDSITKGTLFNDYVTSTFDNDKGKVNISALNSTPANGGYKGSGLFASVKFTVLNDSPTGTTQVKFDYDSADKTKTSDSNVFQYGGTTDVLGQADNASYTIGSSSCGTTTPKGGPTLEDSSETTLPQSGDLSSTWVILGIGFVATVFGFSVIKLKRI